MSERGQGQPASGTEIFLDGSSRGLDPLYRDPTAKIAYSDNPSGELEPSHRITPGNSMFGKRGVLEAMVMIRIERSRESDDQSVEEVDTSGETKEKYPEGFDFKLARKGLDTLRKLTAPEAPRLHDDTIKFQSLLKPIRNQAEAEKNSREAAAAAARQAKAARASRQAKLDRRAAARAAREQELQDQQERQAGRQQQFLELIDQLAVANPDLDYTCFRELGEELVLHKDARGLSAKAQPGFQPKFERRIKSYLGDPRQVLNDLRVEQSIMASTRESTGSPQDDPESIDTYTKQIGITIGRRLNQESYPVTEFSRDDIDKWLDLANLRPTAADPAINPEDPLNVTLSYGQTIILNTLRAIAMRQPKQYVDKLYMIGDAGLDPRAKARSDFTLALMKRCLIDDDRDVDRFLLACTILVPYSQDAKDKASDIGLIVAATEEQEEEQQTTAQMVRRVIARHHHDKSWQNQILGALYPSVNAQQIVNRLKREGSANDLIDRALEGYASKVSAMSETERQATLYTRLN